MSQPEVTGVVTVRVPISRHYGDVRWAECRRALVPVVDDMVVIVALGDASFVVDVPMLADQLCDASRVQVEADDPAVVRQVAVELDRAFARPTEPTVKIEAGWDYPIAVVRKVA